MTDTATTEGASAPTQNAQSAVAAERKRFAAVLGSEHFTAYKSLAENLLATDMSAEEVISALNAASEDSASRVAEASQTKEAPASAQAFFDRMQAENADVPAVSGGPISEAQNLTDPEQAAAASLRATFAQFGVAH